MKKAKVGLLPMYIKLYDDAWPELRLRVDVFYETIVSEFLKKGFDVIKVPICREKSEFEMAIKKFEQNEADVVVTLHLAYSPSLESSDVLARTELPLIILDTTPTFDFSYSQHPDEILYNHGIHGVQDLCNLLRRKGKPFYIEAGHWQESDVLDRVASWIRAGGIASNLRKARVGIIGQPFDGMGDFAVPEGELNEAIGIETIHYDFEAGKELVNSITEAEVATEMDADIKRFTGCKYSEEALHRAALAGLAIRKWIESESLSAFTVNFLSVDKESGLPAMPFLEASKAMARGTGYAGEGDVLTAALVGSLASVYLEVSFTEMFCPDWKSNSIFLSHMGEMNIDIAVHKAVLLEKDFPFTDVGSSIAAYGRFKPGRAAIVDLAPGPGGSFTLIVAPGEMLDVVGVDRMEESIHGWFRPVKEVPDFLASYSSNGGTHHAALVYGIYEQEIVKFGRIMGWNVVFIT